MERTTKIFLLDDTSKALKNQGFSEKQFQSGHSFSSQARYDHFDTPRSALGQGGWMERTGLLCHRMPQDARGKGADSKILLKKRRARTQARLFKKQG